jgi:endonuclease-3
VNKLRKRPFDLDEVMHRIRIAVAPLPKAAMFELAEEGYRSPFQQVVACLISVRTLEEVTLPAARRLLSTAPNAEAVSRLSVDEIDALISPATFHERKAEDIAAIARQALERFGGDLPCDGEVLRSLRGVGPKCANLTLGIACGQPVVAVDTHVHRVTNRWGYVRTATPEQTMRQLELLLPDRYKVEINRLLVPFGKYICTRQAPRCSSCPVLEFCQQVGVTTRKPSSQ